MLRTRTSEDKTKDPVSHRSAATRRRFCESQAPLQEMPGSLSSLLHCKSSIPVVLLDCEFRKASELAKQIQRRLGLPSTLTPPSRGLFVRTRWSQIVELTSEQEYGKMSIKGIPTLANCERNARTLRSLSGSSRSTISGHCLNGSRAIGLYNEQSNNR